MKRLMSLFVMLFLAIFINAGETKVIPLPDLAGAGDIVVDQDRLYVTAAGTFHLFSLGDFKCKKTFGRE